MILTFQITDSWLRIRLPSLWIVNFRGLT